MTTQDVLRQAKGLLSDESRWCQAGYTAANAEGLDVGFDEPGAVRWCLVGALYRAAGTTDRAHSALAAFVQGSPSLGRRAIGLWNDDPETTHAELIAAFDRALLLVAEQENAREAVAA